MSIDPQKAPKTGLCGSRHGKTSVCLCVLPWKTSSACLHQGFHIHKVSPMIHYLRTALHTAEGQVDITDLLSLAVLSHSMSNCHLSSTSLVSRHVITNTSFCTVHSNSHSATQRTNIYCLEPWDLTQQHYTTK